MLTLTPSAVQAVDALLHSNPEIPEDAGLRIAPTSESELSLGIVAAPAPGDQVIEDGGARVFVDEQAAPLVDGAQLDAQAQGDQIAFGLSPQDAGPSTNGAGAA
jgi:Fe-S cluster assembly iron-binding protein IscA